ncbi:hypothetical protein ACFVUN_05460 [Kitasatospora griseola]|uniref:hypothetical protein n=1 Tax=Kitasatospora griseola TaxID=2064 RepID=UPI0036DB1F73
MKWKYSAWTTPVEPVVERREQCWAATTSIMAPQKPATERRSESVVMAMRGRIGRSSEPSGPNSDMGRG